MWDEITVSIPESGDTQEMVEEIRKAVEKETEESARVAEQEWKRGARGDGLSRFSAAAGGESAPVRLGNRPAGPLCDARVGALRRAQPHLPAGDRIAA